MIRGSPFAITYLISKVGVQGEALACQGYDRGDQVSPRHAAMALMRHPEALQLQRDCNGQAPMHGCRRLACTSNTLPSQLQICSSPQGISTNPLCIAFHCALKSRRVVSGMWHVHVWHRRCGVKHVACRCVASHMWHNTCGIKHVASNVWHRTCGFEDVAANM